MHRIHASLLVVGIVTFPTAGSGQEKLTLSEAIGQALAHHPQIEVSRERIAISEGVRKNVGLLPNPRFVFQSENLRGGGSRPFSFSRDTDTFAYVTQVVETGGKRARRVDVAEAAVQRAELEQKLTARQITARVSLAYWSAASAAALQRILEEDVENFSRIVQYHRDRFREGAMAEADLIRVEVEQYRLAASARNATREAEVAAITLLREMGRTDYPRLALAEPEPPLNAVAALDLREVLDRRPEIGLARQAVDQAHANVRLQKANAKPDPELLFGYKRAAGFGDTMLAAVQISIPTVNRNQGLIASAEAEIRASEAQLLATEAMIKGEVAAALQETESRRRMIAETLEPMRERAEETARIAQAAYREGGSDLLRLLDAQRTQIETQLLYHRALAEYQQNLTGLRIAAGLTP